MKNTTRAADVFKKLWFILMLMVSGFILVKSIGLSFSLLVPAIGSVWAIVILIVGVLMLSIGGGAILLYILSEQKIGVIEIAYPSNLLLGSVGLIFRLKACILISGLLMIPAVGCFVLLIIGVVGMTIAMEKDYGVSWSG